MITILDVNDIPPVFATPWSPKQPYYVEQIQEEVPVKTVLKTFTASDPDSDIHHYAIEPESEYFAVNETTGESVSGFVALLNLGVNDCPEYLYFHSLCRCRYDKNTN